MNEEYFKAMYANIWQGNDLNIYDNYYAKDFEEMINACDENKNPEELFMTIGLKKAKNNMQMRVAE